MNVTRSRLLSGAALAAVVAALLVAPGATALPVGVGAGAAHSAPGSDTQIRLITGDIATVVRSGDKTTVNVASPGRTGAAAVFRTSTIGSHSYAVPEDAQPYLGSTLSPELFDVSRFASNPGGALRVRVTLRPGSGALRLPGASTITRLSPTSAMVGFSAAGARVFGDALAKQARLDHASPVHDTGLFRDIVRIAPAGMGPAVPATTPVAGSFTLTINATNWAGAPDNGDGGDVFNVDDVTIFGQGINFTNGTAQVVVPAGPYSLILFFYDFQTGDIYQVTVPQFQVKKDTTVNVSAQNATSQLSITVPKAANVNVLSFGVGRGDSVGGAGSYTFLAGGSNSFFIQPAKKPSIGKLYSFAYERAFSPSTAKSPYTYDVEFPSTGAISANQSYTTQKSQLETIATRYPADVNGTPSLDARFAGLAWQTTLFGADISFTTPTARTEYYLASPQIQWSGVDYQVEIQSPFTLLGEINSGWAVFTAGVKTSTVWGDDPVHPSLYQAATFVNDTICPVCVVGSNLAALSFPFSDNSGVNRSYPDGTASGLSESEAWSIKADSTTISSGSSVLQAEPAMPSGTKKYSIAYSTTRSDDPYFTLSTASSTTWTFPADVQTTALPANWTCTPNGGTSCSVVPVITTQYQLPENLLGQIPSGSAQGSITLGHLAGATAAFKKVKVSVSWDGGSTWTAATVTPEGDGQYSVAFTVPAVGSTNGFGAIRLSASDANGSTVAESVTNAFAVSG